MTTTIQAVRRAAALGVFAATFAAVLLAPGFANATHVTETPVVQARPIPGKSHNAIIVSWDHVHVKFDCRLPLQRYCRSRHLHYLVSIRLQDAVCRRGENDHSRGCIARRVQPDKSAYSETFLGLTPERVYIATVQVGESRNHSGGESWSNSPRYTTYSTARFTTTATPSPPTTPHSHPYAAVSHSHSYASIRHSHSDLNHAHPFAATNHTHDGVPDHTHTYAAADHTHAASATPDPETPAPGSQSCTYEHRIIGVPGTTGAGFTSQILIGSKDATATVKISAFQADNGHAIDVLDSEGAAVGASTSLAPANSIKRFRLEAVTGWHTVIVEHPTKAAMNNATVAMRLREPDTGVSIEHVPGIEHCTTTSTTTETPPTTETPAPDLVIRNPRALLWPQTFDWHATVVNIGDAPAAPTTVRVYHAPRTLEEGSRSRLLDTKAIETKIAAGAEWRMSDYVPRRRDSPSAGDTVHICVAPVPGEAAPDRANNCASATVERN